MNDQASFKAKVNPLLGGSWVPLLLLLRCPGGDGAAAGGGSGRGPEADAGGPRPTLCLDRAVPCTPPPGLSTADV
jgi:hypothetical protein